MGCLPRPYSPLSTPTSDVLARSAYQVNSGSALALRYNDSSVLENHHCSCCFVLLDRSGILKQLESNEVKVLRRLIVAAVLATDSAFPRHGNCGCCLHALNACDVHSASRSGGSQGPGRTRVSSGERLGRSHRR